MTRGQALAVLGLDNRSTLRTMKKAYRAKVKLTHPDKGGDIEKFKELANAYGFLTGRGQVIRPIPQPIRQRVVWVVYGGYSCSSASSTYAGAG